MLSSVDRFFGLSANGTNFSREVTAGLTTSLAMAYITVVNSLILSDAGMDFGAVLLPPAARRPGSLVGLARQLPHRSGSGHGPERLYYAVVVGSGHPWQTALGGFSLRYFICCDQPATYSSLNLNRN